MSKLIWLSFKNRILSLSLAVLAIAMSVALLLGVEKLSVSMRMSFQNAVSGTDLIMGASGSASNLLLYSVFYMGEASRNITWQSYEEIKNDPKIKWTIPISLGDNHRGFRVVGTNGDFFKHFQYGKKQSLEFTKGKAFDDLYDVVIGSQLAKKLGYKLGQKIIVTHGLSQSRYKHKDKPFTIVGILKPTATSIDKSLYVSLEAITAIHMGWETGIPLGAEQFTNEKIAQLDLTPHSISAAFIGLNRKADIFTMQRQINRYQQEPLLAIMPAITLLDLWRNLNNVENALTFVSLMVMLTALFGLTAIMLATLNERRREMAILRSLGANPLYILAMLVGEALFIGLLGIVLGVILLYGAIISFGPWVMDKYGIALGVSGFKASEGLWLVTIWIIIGIISLIPAIRAYFHTLHDGMTYKN
ncbi:MAG: ABC transporter permease [Alphaproteobacteria bacterium]